MREAGKRAGRRQGEDAQDLPTLVFVSRRHCGVSRRMESLVAWVEVTNRGRLRVVDLDADRRPAITARLGVEATPALILLREGSILGRLEGRATGSQIEALLQAAAECRDGGAP